MTDDDRRRAPNLNGAGVTIGARVGDRVAGMRHRCNLGPWVVAAMMVLPHAVIALLGPASIAISDALAG